MLKWFNRMWSLHTESNGPLTVGSRVTTKYGSGVVVNAQVTVDLDVGAKLRPSTKSPRVNITMPVQKIGV